MKFTCGLTFEARKRRDAERWSAEIRWHLWFAWRPVVVGGVVRADCRWLERVWRRRSCVLQTFGTWSYAPAELPRLRDFDHAAQLARSYEQHGKPTPPPGRIA